LSNGIKELESKQKEIEEKIFDDIVKKIEIKQSKKKEYIIISILTSIIIFIFFKKYLI
jgi:hypothetical protein